MSTPCRRPVALALATAVMGLAGLAQAQTAPPPQTSPVPVEGQPPPGYYQPPPPPGYYQPGQPGQPGYYQPGYYQPGYYQPGQPLPPGAVAPNPEAQALYDSGRRMRGAGKALTITGAVLAPLGLIIAVGGVFTGALSAAASCTQNGSASCANSGITGAVIAYYGGLATSVVGVALLGAGIPLWVVGQRRVTRARSLGALGVALDVPRLQLAPLYLPNSSTLAGGTAALSFQF